MDPALELGNEHDVSIERLAFGGEGIARVGGRAVFVPFTAPLDRARIRIVRVGKPRNEAALVELIEPSPLRATPECPHFGACGGCQLQHVRADAQRAAKVEFVRDALRRIGAITFEAPIPIRAGALYGSRTRAEFALDPARAAAGFRRARSHDVLDVERCPVLAPSLQRALDGLRAERSWPARATSVHAQANGEGAVLAYADAEGRTIGPRSAEDLAHLEVPPFRYAFAADGFAQANAELLPVLVEEATVGLAGGLAFDLYCGAGLFSLPLARACARVLAIDESAASVASGRRNAEANDVGNVTFEAARVERWLAHARTLAPDVVVLDPPRSGVDGAGIEALATAGPREIRYVSCDPTTLARDLRGLVARGYRLTRVVALDLFPQTYHVETVATLER